MSLRSRNVPALIASRLPARRARSPKKKLDPTTPRCTSRSPTSSAVAPGGILTTTLPVPSPLNGSNSEMANQIRSATANSAITPAIHSSGRRPRPPRCGAGRGGAGGGGAAAGGGPPPRPPATPPQGPAPPLPPGRAPAPQGGGGGRGGTRGGG